eukprot:g7867.t1
MSRLPALCFGFLAVTTPFSSAFTTSSAATRNIKFRSRPAAPPAAADAFSTMTMAARGRGQQHQHLATESPPPKPAARGAAGDLDATPPSATMSRGGFLAAVGSSAALAAVAVATSPQEASANGMLDFPPARLNNRYFLMRAAQGGADKEGRVQSHPIDKLHMDNRLTEQGVEEAQRAAGVLASLGVSDAFIWADISSRAQDTARILAQELDIRQERVVPEFSFLEPRGMGSFDGEDVASVLPTVYKEDANSLTWRPPPSTDGTPNESVDDVFVRVRQLMSKLETQYQGENVIIVGADSDCLSVLQSFVLGEDMGKHSKYYLRPGEGRQLRTSLDTEVGFEMSREAKGSAVASTGGGLGGEGA